MNNYNKEVILCDYGCNLDANFLFKNEKYCCENHYRKCPGVNKSISYETKKKMSISSKGRKHTDKVKDKLREVNSGKVLTKQVKEKISKKIKKLWKDKNSSYNNIEYRTKNKKKNKRTINKIKQKYPLFFEIEEMRYNPDKLSEKEIQVHCKNHTCKNSKEKGEWFTPTGRQIESRISKIENDGIDCCYFYCSDECKNKCPLFNLKSDPFKDVEIIYTPNEYKTFRKFVLSRDGYKCQYCGEPAEHVHHERPQKLEPFFSLDPDYAISTCKKCHFEKGHKDECSTGNLSKIFCN